MTYRPRYRSTRCISSRSLSNDVMYRGIVLVKSKKLGNGIFDRDVCQWVNRQEPDYKRKTGSRTLVPVARRTLHYKYISARNTNRSNRSVLMYYRVFYTIIPYIPHLHDSYFETARTALINTDVRLPLYLLIKRWSFPPWNIYFYSYYIPIL